MIDANLQNRMMFLVLFGTQDDHYEPEQAASLLRGLRGLDNDSSRVSILLWAEEAAAGLWEERN